MPVSISAFFVFFFYYLLFCFDFSILGLGRDQICILPVWLSAIFRLRLSILFVFFYARFASDEFVN